MQKRKKLLVGNWKMAPATLAEAKHIFGKIKRAASRAKNVTVALCPSDLHLIPLARLARKGKVSLGVQDIFWEDSGLFTGQISPAMAKDAGARFVIIGHSEKRKLGETNEQISKKLATVLRDGLIPILCFGESERDRDGHFYDTLKTQLIESLGRVRSDVFSKSLILAYEPVWEIGRPDMKAMKPNDIHEISIFIRKVINDAFGAGASAAATILYGGSVSPENARAICTEGEADGLLVGRLSLDPDGFSEVIKQLDRNNGKR